MFKDRFSNFCYCIFILFFILSFPVFAQTVYPSCTGGTTVSSATGCFSQSQLNSYSGSCNYPDVFTFTPSGSQCGVETQTHGGFECKRNAQCTCPSGYSLVDGSCIQTPPPECSDPSIIYNGECITPVDEPQDCGITGFPIWIGSGYVCEPDFDTPCPEGTTNGMYTLPGYDPRPYCADASTPNSSSAGSASSSGQNSSTNNSDGGGDGSGSSSGNETGGSSSVASSTGGGGNSSGTASSSGTGGSASSAGAGDCDPTSDDYALCIGFTEEVGDNEAQEIVDGVTSDAQELLDGIYGDIEDDIEAAGIDGEFAEAPSDLENAVMAFLPSPAQCTPFSFQFLGQTKQLPCEKFQEFRLIFGWFLTLCAAAYIWQITIKPVER